MRLILIINLISYSISFSQDFENNKPLKYYADKTIITSQVRSEGNKAILRGTESKKK